MENKTTRPNPLPKNFRRHRWVRIVFRIFLGVVLFIIASYVSLAWYINTHKKEVLESVTRELNENLSGNLAIGEMETTFLQGFPRISMRLGKVTLRDSLFERHGKTLLDARKIDIAVNAMALMRGTVSIRKITIADAAVNMYTDSLGYANTSVFRKKKGKGKSGGGSFPELRSLDLENVSFIIDNKQRGKLYNFDVKELDGKLDYTRSGWDADVTLSAMAKSMAFSTRKGSFIKDKTLEGKFDISFDEASGLLTFQKNRLEIGGERFEIGAKIQTTSPNADFAINIENKEILWKNAGRLLSPNITEKLEMFSISKPIAVKCDLVGGFNIKGDPLIRVNAEVNDNTLDTPGGIVEHCSFFGVFTNEHIPGKGYSDANSAIKLYDFKGDYSGIPLSMKKVFILDLEKPVAVGDFSSDFEMKKLAAIIDEDLLKFSKGKAHVKLDFRADIVDFKLSKPYVNGIIEVKDADVNYVPRKLDFKDVSVALNFTKDNLYISKIVLKRGKSIVNMEGSIMNFLNLYYTDPEKVTLTWNVNSPQLHLNDFMGFAGGRQRSRGIAKKQSKGNITEDLDMLFEKSNVDVKLRVDKLYYNSFAATNAKADILLTEKGITIANAGLQHAGGTLGLNGALMQKGKVNSYNVNTTISNVDINRFFQAFDNFGMETLAATNLQGLITAKANVSGNITDAGTLVPRSMYGNVAFALKKGRLIDFEPVKNVGKYAFPFRDMKNIEFYNLNGKFDVKGEKVVIHPMKINSSVLNMDVEGVYSFGKGTGIYIDVPLRNPKRDKDITDEKELAKRRNRGIVLHLKAEDDEDGKVKVKLGGKKD